MAIAVALATGAGVCVSVATVHDLSSHGGSLPGGLFLAAVLVALAWGMWERRYWAVLGFEALLAFQIIVTSLALVVAETLLAAAVCVVSDRARRLAVLEAGHGSWAASSRRARTKTDADDRLVPHSRRASGLGLSCDRLAPAWLRPPTTAS